MSSMSVLSICLSTDEVDGAVVAMPDGICSASECDYSNGQKWFSTGHQVK